MGSCIKPFRRISPSGFTSDRRVVKINLGKLGKKRMGRRVIDGCHEPILARLDHFSGIYGALSAGRWASGSPAFRFSFGEANRQKVKFV